MLFTWWPGLQCRDRRFTMNIALEDHSQRGDGIHGRLTRLSQLGRRRGQICENLGCNLLKVRVPDAQNRL